MDTRTAARNDSNLPVSERVYRLVRKAILDLSLQPGARIGENVLAADIGVSRTPVREAMQRLEREGLVLVFPQRGSFVAPLDLQAIREAFFVRLSLECSVAAEAARRRSEIDIAFLRGAIAEQRAVVASGSGYAGSGIADEGFFGLNTAFHRNLMSIADLDGVWRVVENAKVQLDRARVAHLAHVDPYPLTPLVDQHEAIVEAIAAADADAAHAAMSGNIQPLLPRLDRLKAQRPDLFELPGDLNQPLELRPRRPAPSRK